MLNIILNAEYFVQIDFFSPTKSHSFGDGLDNFFVFLCLLVAFDATDVVVVVIKANDDYACSIFLERFNSIFIPLLLLLFLLYFLSLMMII